MTFPTRFRIDSPYLLPQLQIATAMLPLVQRLAALSAIQPCIIAGIISRESAWGLTLHPEGAGGTGDWAKRFGYSQKTGLPPDGHGYGRGLMQIDYEEHEFARTGNWQDTEANITEGCKILADGRKFISAHLKGEGLPALRAMISAFNCGPGNVVRAVGRGIDVDHYTTGLNYSADVLQRAGWFQLHGWA